MSGTKNGAVKYVTTMQTPLGCLVLAADEDFLLYTGFDKEALFPRLQGRVVYRSNAVLEQAEQELTAYFKRELRDFTVLYQLTGTDFQQKVWRGLTGIPYGQTKSYAELAGQIGRPKACRAVGQANNKNPLSIIVPCHRVIGKDGSLVGYGGGLDRKIWLLNHERSI
jgi:methylated-DNA-[protein]-cysteine S-methyltransferase